MSDSTINGSVHDEMHHAKRVPKAEFLVYFTMIVCLAVVPHMIGWTCQAIRHGKLPRLSPVMRAWKDAQAVTPMIFRG